MIQLYWKEVTSLITLYTQRDGKGAFGKGFMASGGHTTHSLQNLERILIESRLYEPFYSRDDTQTVKISREAHEASYSRIRFIIGLDSLDVRLPDKEEQAEAVHAYGGLFRDTEMPLGKAPVPNKNQSLVLRAGKRTYHALLLSDGNVALRYVNSTQGEEISISLIYSNAAHLGVLPFRSSVREIKEDVERARRSLKISDDRKVFPDMIAVGWMMTQASLKVTPSMKAGYVGEPGSDHYKGKN